MKLIVGLGNIGRKYEHNRHNIGFLVADALQITLEASAWSEENKFHGEIAQAQNSGETIYLLKPSTMMNDSGRAVQAVLQFYKLNPADVWIIYDDVDLEFGKIRVRLSGDSISGQRGVVSVRQAIGADFVRVRIGIGDNRAYGLRSEVYVLTDFNQEQAAQLPTVIIQASTLIQQALMSGLQPHTQ